MFGIAGLIVRARRRLILAAAAALFATSALAQQELKITVPAAPGGGWDQTARAMQQALVSAGLARSVEVMNVPGARGVNGFTQFVRQGAGDRTQVAVVGFGLICALLRNKAQPTSLDEAAPLARLTSEYFVIAVPPDSAVANVHDLAEAIKTDPSKVVWGGGPLGGMDHVLAILFTKAAGADPSRMAYAPHFGSGELLSAAAEGKVAAEIWSAGQAVEHIRSGKLRVLAISAPARIEMIDAPTLKEQGIDLVLANWRAVLAPPDLSSDGRAELSRLVDAMVGLPSWQDSLRQKGWQDAYLTGDALAAFLREEQARVAEALRSAGLLKPSSP